LRSRVLPMWSLSSLVAWVTDTFGRFGLFGLFLLAFTEASLNPIPIEVLFIPFVLAHPTLIVWAVLVTVLGSGLGGILGYYLGYAGKLAILKRFFSEQRIQHVHHLFEKYEAWAVFAGGFTPLPYKIVTIGAGVFEISFKKFVALVFISRFLRFSLEALFLFFFGNAVLSYFQSLFGFLSLGITLFLIITFLVFRKWKKKRHFLKNSSDTNNEDHHKKELI